MFHGEYQGIAGFLTIRAYDRAGRLAHETGAANDITDAGRELVGRLFNYTLIGDGKDEIKRVNHIRVGSSETKFSSDQLTLQAPIKNGDNPVKISLGEVSAALVPNQKNNGNRYKLTLTGEMDENTANGELREAGLFTDDGTMYNRVTFPLITKTEQFRFTLIWEIMF